MNCLAINGTVEGPAPVTVELDDSSSTVQDVMELGADDNTEYQFTVTYYNRSTGYEINAVSGVWEEDDCQWYLFYQAPEVDAPQFQRGARISKFMVEANSTVVLKYQPPPAIPPSPTPSPTPMATDDDDSAPPIVTANMLAVLLCLFIGLAIPL